MDKKEIEQIADLRLRVRQMVGNIQRCYSGCKDPCEGCEYRCRPDCGSAQALEAAALLMEMDHLLAAMPNPRKEVLLVKAEYHLRSEELEAIRHKILSELREGVVLLPKGFEPWLIPEDVEVRVDGK